MCAHPLHHLVLPKMADGHCQYPHFKDGQTISRGEWTPKSQTRSFCSRCPMLMETLLSCHRDIRTGPREEELSWVATPALTDSKMRCKSYCFFSFWKSQPRSMPAFHKPSAFSVITLAISWAENGVLICLVCYRKGS